ncbi:TIGR04500 family putative peptide maturation system protein [Microbispora cellulosiformans]|uniref:TIGR04500 family putative peptide maturation system protein n=1 Tax=Microbispora cellulosiformans TaxID=2614688 RepID=A0A5J5K2X0_9ACTN|nr:TIGR04500 family putative peptide maturation system protein [Microbispora cellulosiformans]KAA9378334.1 TIGR04500 family putative peptide maturation system protein [Microbispora cellulosiformans]
MLPDALETLRGLDGAEPSEARERLRELRERHPGVRFRLLWQREDYDDSLHYDLLIKRPGEGTVSLSWCPDRALPWPLRGVQRAGETLLLRIDGVGVKVVDAVARLDFLWDEARLVDRIVAAALVQAELEEAPVELFDHEIQEAVDAFRRARGLLTAERTREWMDRRSLTLVDLRELVAGEVAVARVRERVTAGRVEPYFEEHREEFGTARVARLTFPGSEAALRAAAEIDAGAGFFAPAERTRGARLVVEDVPAAEIGTARPGDVVSPAPDVLLKVISVAGAELDADTRRRVERRVFDLWIDERRRAAKIEWFWGTTARTGTR